MNLLAAYAESYNLNFAWGCFLFPGLLIAAIIFAVRARKKYGLALAITLPVVACLVAFAALFVVRGSRQVSYSHSEHYDEGATLYGPPAADLAPASPAALVSGSSDDSVPLAEAPLDANPVLDDIATDLDADVYPSKRTGAIVATRRVLRSLDKLVPNGVKLDSLVIKQGLPEIRSIVADTARDMLPGVNIILDESPPDRKEGETRLNISLDTPTFSRGESHITATLFSDTGGPRPSETVQVRSKPWLDGQEQQPPAPGVHYFPVRSDLAGNPDEARQRAISQALARIQPVIESRLARSSRFPLSPSDHTWLADAIRDDLTSRGWIADRFSQQIRRPYARLCREALLVAISEPDLASATQRYARELEQRRTGVRTTILMAGGLALGIIVLYLFLNAATKGYYMWPLRLVGIAAVVGGVILVLNLA